MSIRFLHRFLSRNFEGLALFRRVWQYRRSLSRGPSPVVDSMRGLLEICWRVFVERKRILFLPELPLPLFVIYKILLFQGYRLTDDPSLKVQLAIKWLNAMDGSPFLPEIPLLNELRQFAPRTTVINSRCHDVSKRHVNAVFENVFGYSLAVFPQTFRGRCVMKSNWNGLHIGQIIDCPIMNPDESFVYQKVINNETEYGLVEDIRVPIFKGIIPFVYIKARAIDVRLVDRDHTNRNVRICETLQYLREEEVRKIRRFCEEIGLDYGEIDVLRDRNDEKIYIVDVNNNPAGPPEPISETERAKAIVRLAKAFEEAFAS